jgi:GxxExxY protein
VFRELGHGFSNIVYRRAMALVLRSEGHAVIEEAPLHVLFRGQLIGDFRADLVIDRVVLAEIKPSKEIEKSGEAQLLNYLKAAGGGVGLLLNFGHKAEFKRFVMGDPASSLPLLR